MDQLSLKAKVFLEANKGKKIVFTNGCFDILHRGHIEYLKDAKKCGDILIVGLNSDESIKRLNKGLDRPINQEADRKLFLDSFSFVDHVEVFDDDTPLELIKQIKPDVLVKGGDWSKEDVIGADFVEANGGAFKSINFVDGFSTTSFIKMLQGKK